MTRRRESTPASVEAFMRYVVQGDEAALRALAPHLAPRVALEWVRGPITGAETVLAELPTFPFTRPGLFEGVEWHPSSSADDETVTMRGLCPPDRMFPGGRLSAFDFLFTLDGEGRLARIRLKPHHTEPDDVAAPLAIGATAPDFILPDAHGHPVSLHGEPASATVVLWTGNQCPFARAWHERLQSIARDYAPRGVRMLQINANDPSVFPADALEGCISRAAEFAGPYLIDAHQKVAKAWGARVTPDIFVLDGAGRVAYHGAPDAAFSEDEPAPDILLDGDWVRAALDAVLAGEPVARPRTRPHGCNIKWTFDSPLGAS